MNAQKQPTGSAYFIVENKEKPRTHVLSVLVDNEPGVLARVIVHQNRQDMRAGFFLVLNDEIG